MRLKVQIPDILQQKLLEVWEERTGVLAVLFGGGAIHALANESLVGFCVAASSLALAIACRRWWYRS